MNSTEITVKAGDKIKVLRRRYETRPVILTVKSIQDDGLIIALRYNRQARGGGWVAHETVVRPNEVLAIVE